MPFQFRIRTLMIFTAIVGLALLAIDRSATIFADGVFELTVRLNDRHVSSITRLDYVCGERSTAEFVVAERNPAHFQPVSLVRREFVAIVNWSEKESPLGWRKNYNHPSYIVIWAHYRDGSEHCQIAEIPFGRGDRTIDVDFGPEQAKKVVNESPSSEPDHGSKGR